MAKRKRAVHERTEEWAQLRLLLKWPEQVVYELIRPVVIFGETAGARARATGEQERTIDRRADRFDREGLPGLYRQERREPVEDPRGLPPPMRQRIVDLRAEVPSMSLREIADVCDVEFGRRPSHHTVQKILAAGPAPSRTTRRFPPYAQIGEPIQRRLAIVRLHAEGWRVRTIARYLETTPRTVYRTLARWAGEQFAGLADKSHAPKQPATKATLATTNEVRKLQRNPDLGAWRIHAALLQLGIKASPRTCGRILARNRALYGLDKPKRSPRPKKKMPYKASKRHEYWSIDIRYIERHRLADPKPVFVISILENYSRALLASALSPTQDLLAVLVVVYEALRRCGAPEAVVSDGGAVFRAKQLLHAYEALGVRREQIPQGQPWTNYIESHFGIMRRLADFDFARAETWEAMLAVHERFVRDYNAQVHWAHRDRQDGRHSPAAVLGWVQGTAYPEEVLRRVLYAVQFTRRVDRHGYIRFRHWRLYGERGLAGTPVAVWVYDGSLRLEYQTVLLSMYAVVLQGDGKHFREVKHPRLAETRFRSPQLTLFDLGPDEWLLFLRLPAYAPRKRVTPGGATQLPLPLEAVRIG